MWKYLYCLCNKWVWACRWPYRTRHIV